MGCCPECPGGRLKPEALRFRLGDKSIADVSQMSITEFKEWIDEKTGIDVFYGTQYLQSLDEEERLQHLDSYPLLPCGLVVSKPQWEKINHRL